MVVHADTLALWQTSACGALEAKRRAFQCRAPRAPVTVDRPTADGTSREHAPRDAVPG